MIKWHKIDGCWHAFREDGRSLCGKWEMDFRTFTGPSSPPDRYCCWSCHTTIKTEALTGD